MNRFRAEVPKSRSVVHQSKLPDPVQAPRALTGTASDSGPSPIGLRRAHGGAGAARRIDSNHPTLRIPVDLGVVGCKV
eukprot:751759-Hanusia_phi.AAC.5